MKTISFCINTSKNELNHIKLLLRSLKENLHDLNHEILVFIDSDNQDTFKWLLTQKSIFPNLKILRNELPIPYGYQRNINELFKEASNEIVSYLQSDMVVCKDYDLEVLKHLEPNMILCSTRIEPPLHGNSGEKITHDFGLDPEKFDLTSFTTFANNQKQNKITEYFFAPFTLYKDVWNSIGGHDTMFRRSREDSDILTRLVLNNTKIIQVWNAVVYHFTCTSSRGKDWFNQNNKEAQDRVQLQQMADNIELSRFHKKWGMFSHSTNKVKHYNITAKILGIGCPVSKFSSFETFFHKVYVEDASLIASSQNEYDAQHLIANKLFNISNKDWNEYGYIYNQLQSKQRIFNLNDSLIKEDIIIEFDINEVGEKYIYEFLQYLQLIIDDTDDLDELEYGPFKVKINKKIDRSSNNIKISNPKVLLEHRFKTY